MYDSQGSFLVKTLEEVRPSPLFLLPVPIPSPVSSCTHELVMLSPASAPFAPFVHIIPSIAIAIDSLSLSLSFPLLGSRSTFKNSQSEHQNRPKMPKTAEDDSRRNPKGLNRKSRDTRKLTGHPYTAITIEFRARGSAEAVRCGC